MTTQTKRRTAERIEAPEVLAVRPPVAWRMLGIGPSTGWKLVKSGRLRVVRVGCNITMIEMAELRRFLAAHAVAPELPDATD
jgi:hypothetical protein